MYYNRPRWISTAEELRCGVREKHTLTQKNVARLRLEPRRRPAQAAGLSETEYTRLLASGPCTRRRSGIGRGRFARMTRRCLFIVGRPAINMHRRRSFARRTVSFITGGADKRSAPEIPPFVIPPVTPAASCIDPQERSAAAVGGGPLAGGSLSRPRRSYCSL